MVSNFFGCGVQEYDDARLEQLVHVILSFFVAMVSDGRAEHNFIK